MSRKPSKDQKCKVGFVVLAHDNVFRLRQMLSYLIRQGAPIALHLDSKMPDYQRKMLEHFFGDSKQVYWAQCIPVEWGQWSIVDAQIRTTKLLLQNEAGLDYVYHISGSCLPLRPVSELEEFLAGHKQPTDFIESVAIEHEDWVYDGLNQERVDFYHPFSWKTQRRRFDLNVKIQRRLRVKRKFPQGLTKSFGSQWWCLSAGTLKRIFADEKFDEYCRFFSKTWIPDESFFQTLVRKHSHRIEARSLSYSTFDGQGKPFLIYDDHVPILERLDRFFVRKVWRGADDLYNYFLNPQRELLKRDAFAELELGALLDHAREGAVNGRNGLISQFRRPKHYPKMETRAPYFVYIGVNSVRKQIYNYFIGSPTKAQMGYLFHPNRTEFELTKHKTPKNAKDLHKFRDYHRQQFLMQRVWYAYPRNIAFLAKPHHLNKLIRPLSEDHHANIIMIRGAWVFELFHRNIQNIDRLRVTSNIELRRERRFLAPFEKEHAAHFVSFDFTDLLAHPEQVATAFPDQLSLHSPKINRKEFMSFLEILQNNGVDLKQYKISQLQQWLKGTPSADESENIISIENYVRAQNQ